MDKDCFYIVEILEDEQYIRAICTECRELHYPQNGWFWEGSKRGYGQWNVTCNHCKKQISSFDEQSNYEN